MAFGLAVYASQGGSLQPHARLASGCWSGSTGWAFHPQDSDERFQICFLHLILLSQALLAQWGRPTQRKKTQPSTSNIGEADRRCTQFEYGQRGPHGPRESESRHPVTNPGLSDLSAMLFQKLLGVPGVAQSMGKSSPARVRAVGHAGKLECRVGRVSNTSRAASFRDRSFFCRQGWRRRRLPCTMPCWVSVATNQHRYRPCRARTRRRWRRVRGWVGWQHQ